MGRGISELSMIRSSGCKSFDFHWYFLRFDLCSVVVKTIPNIWNIPGEVSGVDFRVKQKT